jgi:hypothetical protein
MCYEVRMVAVWHEDFAPGQIRRRINNKRQLFAGCILPATHEPVDRTIKRISGQSRRKRKYFVSFIDKFICIVYYYFTI